MRPKSEVFNPYYETPTESAGTGPKAGEGIQDSEFDRIARRATGEGENDERRAPTRTRKFQDRRSIWQRCASEAREGRRKAILAEPGRTGGNAGVSRTCSKTNFPQDPAKEAEGIDRRDVLKLMAASAAMAGLSACTKLPTRENRSVREAAGRNHSRASRCSMPRPCRNRASHAGCWWRATWGGRRKSKAIRSIPAAWAARTCSRRRRY